MTYRKFTSWAMATTLLTSLTAFNAAYAQDADEPEETNAQEDDGDRERITVTGSRLRRDEFSTASPVQIIDAAEGRQIGITDTTALIAENPVVTGAQLDGSINSGSPTAAVEGVPVNGPGSATVALRGLGAERTLLLVNGRRIGPSGVRGAPISPDLNLIPSALIDRVEILTDGASSVYGADAVAGVANLILRNDFEGFEVNAFTSLPEMGGGEVTQISFIGGASNDRSNFTVAGEFYNRNAIILRDRTEWNECLSDIEIDTNGVIYKECIDSRPDEAALILSQGFLFSTPGSTDVGIPGWSSGDGTTLATGQNWRSNPIYNLIDEELNTQLLESTERMNLFASGFYDLDFFERDRFYFELSYSTRNSVGRFTNEQNFPGVPGFIPQEDVDGNIIVDGTGAPVLVQNPLNPFGEDALPVYSNFGLSQRRSSDVDTFRAVFGMEGDVPIDFLMDRNWVYDVSFAYDRSFGVAYQPILDEFSLRESLDTLRLNSDGEVVCGLERSSVGFGFITPRECVPVNFFADNLFLTRGGDKNFTEEEQAFLFGNSINTTEIEQVHVQALFTGDVFELPAGSVGLVIGSEFREQRINSVNDFTRTSGGGASEIPDQEPNTVGRTSLAEFFLETEIPVTDSFTFNAAGRYTEEENFGAAVTYSVRADWQVTDEFRLRSTFGTSYRAPNLREQFLAGGTETIPGGADPCLVPAVARPGGVYDASLDERQQIVLDNCIADGVDPTALGAQGVTGILVRTGGSTDLEAETSESLTAGFVYSNTFFDDWDFDLAVTYFDIQVENTVEEANATGIIANCYNREANLADVSCSRITRRGGNPALNSIGLVESGFLNIGLVSSTGVDYNVRMTKPLDWVDDQTDLTLSLNVAQYIEQNFQPEPDADIIDRVGELSNPEWIAQFSATVDRNNWSTRWRTRYQDAAHKREDLRDPYTDRNPAAISPASACDALGNTTTQCKDVDFVPPYFVHDVSISYEHDDWNFSAGVNNVFNESPPLIDQGEGPTRMNFVVQSGYDLFGRRFFAGVTRRF